MRGVEEPTREGQGEPVEQAAASDVYGGPKVSRRTKKGTAKALRYLTMPVLLLLACVALYLWVGSQDLDSNERRVINSGEIIGRTVQHLQISAVATSIVVVLAITTGVILTRPTMRRVAPAIVSIANIGQAVPAIGLLALLAIVWRLGFWTLVVGLIAYAFLPVLRNTMVGLQQVDRSVIEAGRGMGMTKNAVLFRIELPLAIPIMLAGIRTALIIVVGTAVLGVFIDGGGLGAIIDPGIKLSRDVIIYTGAVLTAVVALFIDWLAGVAEDVLKPKGL